MDTKTPTVLVYSESEGGWMRFEDPVTVVTAEVAAEVLPALKLVERLTQTDQYYAAGFVSYEAACGLCDNLVVKSPPDFPLLWFGIFAEWKSWSPEQYELPGDEWNLRWKPSIDHSCYRKALTKIKDSIALGETYQVNYTYRLSADMKQSPFPFFLNMLAAQERSYAAYIDTGEWCICSASPELFFSLDGDRIVSRPMKGTAPRGMTTEEDVVAGENLMNSEKNRAENIMITDMVRNDLGRIAQTGSVETTEICKLEKYPTLWQMTSRIEALTGAALHEIFKALFPPSSITGAPKHRTMEIIAQIEDSPRRIYTGAVGYIAPGRRAQFNVAIRSLLLNKQTARAEYGVGGGIVWDSVDDSEMAETKTKAEVLSRRQSRFSILETMLWRPDSGYHLLDRHIHRAELSAEYFSFPFDRDLLSRCLNEETRLMDSDDHRVRVLIDSEGGISIESALLRRPSCDMPRVALARSPVDSRDPFLYHKTSNRCVYENAKISGYDDIILWNQKKEVTESTIANVLLEIDGELLTPPVSAGLLAGTKRADLLEQGVCRESRLLVEDLQRATRIYLVNSVRGIYRISVDMCSIVF